MLCTKFELIPIKIGFFTNFQSCFKIGPKTLYYIVQGLWPNFAKNDKYYMYMYILTDTTCTCTY